MKPLSPLLLLLLLSLFALLPTACSRPQSHPVLVAADDVMESAPDSALALLEAADCAVFTPADSDYYALLLTQAQIKTDDYVCSDTLISRAREAYRDSPDRDLRRRAAFYSAQVALNGGRLPRAMREAVEAYSLSDNNHYWRAKSAELIADIFSETYNYDSETDYRREAAAEYLAAGRMRSHRFVLCDLITTYNNKGEYDAARLLCDSIEPQVLCSRDSLLINYFAGVKFPLMLGIGDLQEVENVLSGYNEDDSYASKINTAIVNSYMAAWKGDTAARDEYLLFGNSLSDDERNRVMIIYARYRQAMMNEDYHFAAQMCDTLLLMQSRITYDVLKESVVSAQRDFYSEEAMRLQQRSSTLRMQLLCVIAVGLLLIALLVVIYRLKMRARKAELDLLLKNIVELKDVTVRNNDKIAKLFKEQWRTLNQLCSSYFDLEKPVDQRRTLLEKIEQEINKFRKPKTIREMERLIDENMNGLMTAIRRECDFLNENDITLLVFILSGFSSQVVCLIMDIKYKNFYLKKSRLIKKIKDSDVSVKDAVMQQIVL